MAVPTFSSVTPTSGHPGGRELVRISGTNFRLPDTLPTTTPTVRVRFGSETALRVDVVDVHLLEVLTPQYREADLALPPVAIEITNLDNAGVAIPGETVTAAAAFTYARPGLRAPAVDHVPRAVLTELIRMFRRQVLRNTVVRVHTDYAESAAPTKLFSHLPVLWLSALQMPLEDGTRRRDNEPGSRLVDGVFYEELWPSQTYRLLATLNGATDRVGELWNLAQACLDAVDRTVYLQVDDATLGRLQFPLEHAREGVAYGIVPSDDNIATFSLDLAVRDIEVRLSQPVRRTTAAGTFSFDVGQLIDGAVVNPETVDLDD